MSYFIQFLFIIALTSGLSSCQGQNETKAQEVDSNSDSETIVGGGCDGCELMFVDMPSTIHSTDTSAGWQENGQKLLVTGTVYEQGGKIPASDVIIYYWQTDNDGHYSPKEGMTESAKRHGHIRGWVKSDKNGNYSIYTIRPAPYPDRDIAAHIHISIKEPSIENEYYIDALVFDDDLLLVGDQRNDLENRGGSGILRVLIDDELQIAEHDIILGLNIPDYPKKKELAIVSGREIGEDNPSFTPYHAFGPDKGTTTCPVCKYGRFHGIIYFVGNNPNWIDIRKWLFFLELESKQRREYLKVYFVYGNENDYDHQERKNELNRIGNELKLENTALTFVPSFSDIKSEVHLNKINEEAENTFIIYKNSKIIDKYINLKPTKQNFKRISTTLDKTKNDYFYLPKPQHH